MKLQALRAENFKKHVDLTIEFSETLTVIRGPNWAGKSSILHAIFFALFGAVAVPCQKERIPTRGQKNTKVTLWFDWNGVDCVIERTLSTCTLYVDGALKATGATAVTDMVKDEILGLTLQEAMALAYSPQSQTAALLTLGVPALNRMIESLSKADDIEKLITRASSIVTKSENGLSAVGEALDEVEPAEQVEIWSGEVERTHEEFRDADTRVTDVQGEMQVLEIEYSEKSERNEKLLFARSDREQLKRVMEDLATCATDLAALGSDNLKELEMGVLEYEARVRDLSNKEVEVQRARTSLVRLDEWFDSVGKEWEEKEKNIPLLEAARDNRERIRNPINVVSQAEIAARAVLLQKSQERESGVCHACNRPFGEHDPKAAEQAERAAEIVYLDAMQKRAELQEQETAFQREIWRLEKLQPPAGYEDTHAAKVAEYESLQKFLGTIDEAKLATNLRLARAKLSEIQQGIATARATASQRARLLLVQGTRQQEKASLEKALAGYPSGEPESLTELVKRIDTQKVKVREAYDNKTAKQQAFHEAQSSLKAWQVTLQQAIDRNAKRKDLEKRAERFSAVVKWLRASKSAFLGQIWDNLTLIGSEIISNATMGYASSLHRTDEGEFVVIEDGVDVPMISASGGMQAICGVGLRMALDHVLAQSVGFVVLDEPSSELNDEHAASLAGALRAQQRQVILVTHREGEEFVSDTVITL